MEDIILKRGASLLLSFAFMDEDCVATDLTGATVTSQLRDAQDELVSALPVTVPIPTTGVAGVQVLDTTGFPIGTLRCDIRVVIGGMTTFSETFAIHVQKAVTR